MWNKLKFLGKFMLIGGWLAIMLLAINLRWLSNFQYLYAELASWARLFPDERVFEYVFTHGGFFISGFITLVILFTISCFSLYLTILFVFPGVILKVQECFLKAKTLISKRVQQGIILGSVLTAGLYLGVFISATYGYLNFKYTLYLYKTPNIFLEEIYLAPLLVLFLDAMEKSKLLLIIGTVLHWPVVCAVGALLLDKVQKARPHNRKE